MSVSLEISEMGVANVNMITLSFMSSRADGSFEAAELFVQACCDDGNHFSFSLSLNVLKNKNSYIFFRFFFLLQCSRHVSDNINRKNPSVLL